MLELLKFGYGCEENEYNYSNYPNINVDFLRKIYCSLNKEVLGQEECKKHIISGMYRLINNGLKRKNIVLMKYDPSGVGKTESATIISQSLWGRVV